MDRYLEPFPLHILLRNVHLARMAFNESLVELSLCDDRRIVISMEWPLYPRLPGLKYSFPC